MIESHKTYEPRKKISKTQIDIDSIYPEVKVPSLTSNPLEVITNDNHIRVDAVYSTVKEARRVKIYKRFSVILNALSISALYVTIGLLVSALILREALIILLLPLIVVYYWLLINWALCAFMLFPFLYFRTRTPERYRESDKLSIVVCSLPWIYILIFIPFYKNSLMFMHNRWLIF